MLCPEQLPNGIQGEPYESSATFNLPPSVTDPGSGLEATLLTVTISSVTGLPFGLEFSPNNPNGVYQPQDGEYYGCAVVAARLWSVVHFRGHQCDGTCVCLWLPADSE